MVQNISNVQNRLVNHPGLAGYDVEAPRIWKSWIDLERSTERSGSIAMQAADVLNAERDEKLDKLVREVSSLRKTNSRLEKTINSLEQTLHEVRGSLLAMSQAYYWTPTWREMEARADKEEAQGRSRRFSSAEDLIRELNE